MPTSRLFGGSRPTSRPLISTRRGVGSTNPAMIRSVVVLPQPEGPSSVRNSPSSTVRSSAASASTSPYRCSTPSSTTLGGRFVGEHASPADGPVPSLNIGRLVHLAEIDAIHLGEILRRQTQEGVFGIGLQLGERALVHRHLSALGQDRDLHWLGQELVDDTLDPLVVLCDL